MIKYFLALATVAVAYERTSFNDVEKTIGEIITQHGYTFEEHTAQTSDGYDLTLHRIKGSGKPVLLMHGLSSASNIYVLNEKEKTPAFKLAAEGYDVWIGNNRGGYYTQTHKTLKITESAFWHFTVDDLAIYDLPTMIDKILAVSGASKLAAYLGHSNGSSQFFAGASLDPDYFESKVQLFIALAPVTRIHYNTPASLFSFGVLWFWFVQSFGFWDYKAPKIEAVAEGKACWDDWDKCKEFNGVDDDKTKNKGRIPVIQAHIGGFYGNFGSWMVLEQYVQWIKAEKFQRYDWGPVGNMEKYKQSTAPEFDLSKIKVETILVMGKQDDLTNSIYYRSWLLLESGLKVADYFEYDDLAHESFVLGQVVDDYLNQLVTSINLKNQ